MENGNSPNHKNSSPTMIFSLKNLVNLAKSKNSFNNTSSEIPQVFLESLSNTAFIPEGNNQIIKI